MQYIGDTKAGTLIGTDRYGNKYYENVEEELPRMDAPAPTPHLLHEVKRREADR